METASDHATGASSEDKEPPNSSTLYGDYIICYNLGGCSTPANSHRAACSAVLEAYKTASELDKTPGAIAIQEYPWSNALLEGLKSDLTRIAGVPWGHARQWSERPQADALILYNTTKYSSKVIEASKIVLSNNIIHSEANHGVDIAENVSLDGRWAAAQLTAGDPATAASLPWQFNLVSFHGRDDHQEDDEATNERFEPVKKAVAREFIAQVASIGATGALGGENSDTNNVFKGAPALIVGDWGIDVGSFRTLDDVRENDDLDFVFKQQGHAPLGHARTTRTGSIADTIDYAVSINHLHSNSLKFGNSLAVADVLPLRQRAFFDHAPLLIKISLSPWQPSLVPEIIKGKKRNTNGLNLHKKKEENGVPPPKETATTTAPATPNLINASLAASTRSRDSYYDIERAYSSYNPEERKVGSRR